MRLKKLLSFVACVCLLRLPVAAQLGELSSGWSPLKIAPITQQLGDASDTISSLPRAFAIKRPGELSAILFTRRDDGYSAEVWESGQSRISAIPMRAKSLGKGCYLLLDPHDHALLFRVIDRSQAQCLSIQDFKPLFQRFQDSGLQVEGLKRTSSFASNFLGSTGSSHFKVHIRDAGDLERSLEALREAMLSQASSADRVAILTTAEEIQKATAGR